MCKAINNSTPEQKAKYYEGMAKSLPHKSQLILPWLEDAAKVVDLGCADGAFASQLRFSGDFREIIGIDLSHEAIETAKKKEPEWIDGSKLTFKHGAAETFRLDENVDAVVCSSIMHEVFSYSKKIDPWQSVEQALNNIRKNLAHGGRLIIRDFVAPEPNITVNFEHFKSDMTKGFTYQDFHTQRRTDPQYSWKFSPNGEHDDAYVYHGQKIQDVYEYIFHKDYHTNWETEIKETYGFWTGTQAKAQLKLLGYEIEHYAELDNEWITSNRLEGKVKLLDGNVTVPFPKYQCLIVARKA